MASVSPSGKPHDRRLYPRLGELAVSTDVVVDRTGNGHGRVMPRGRRAVVHEDRAEVGDPDLPQVPPHVGAVAVGHAELVADSRGVAEEVARAGVLGDESQCLPRARAADQDQDGVLQRSSVVDGFGDVDGRTLERRGDRRPTSAVAASARPPGGGSARPTGEVEPVRRGVSPRTRPRRCRTPPGRRRAHRGWRRSWPGGRRCGR